MDTSIEQSFGDVRDLGDRGHYVKGQQGSHPMQSKCNNIAEQKT